MNTKFISTVASLSLLATGCNKSPNSAITVSKDGQPASLQAEAFERQVYRSLDGGSVLTLISREKCELSEGGTTLECRYSKEDDKLRVVTIALSTSKEINFRFTGEGLQDDNGNVLFSPERYASAIEQLRRHEEEQERQRLETQRQEQHSAERIANAKRENQMIAKYSLVFEPRLARDGSAIRCEGTLTLTDASLKLHIFEHDSTYSVREFDSVTYFFRVREIGAVGEGAQGSAFFVNAEHNPDDPSDYPPAHQVFHCRSADEARTIQEAIVNAFNAWKAKFPEAALR